MKILYIVPYVPNLIRVRPFQLMRALKRRGHDVSVATLWTMETERRDLSVLKSEGIPFLAQRLPLARSLWNCVMALPSQAPLQAAYCWLPDFARVLQRRIDAERFDVIHVEHLRGARYGVHLKKMLGASPISPPIIWDSVDCISHLFGQAVQHSRSLYGRLITGLDLKRTQRYEGWLVRQFDHVVTTSIQDADALRALARQTPLQNGDPESARSVGQAADTITVVPNGVDLDYFAPNGATRDAATIVFTGKMSYHANVTAALHLVQDIMPHIWAERPDVQVQIVGKDPPPEIRALATQTNGKDSVAAHRVTVTGTVPDLRPYLQRATLAVAPVPYGAGIQNKVLEAMACGAPVVATAQAASGLDAAAGRDLLVAEDAASFARASLSLLNDPMRREQLGQAGLSYVQRAHSWQAAVMRLERVYQGAIDGERTDNISKRH